MQAVVKKNKKNKKKVIVGATDNALLKGVCKSQLYVSVDWNQASLLILLVIV